MIYPKSWDTSKFPICLSSKSVQCRNTLLGSLLKFTTGSEDLAFLARRGSWPWVLPGPSLVNQRGHDQTANQKLNSACLHRHSNWKRMRALLVSGTHSGYTNFLNQKTHLSLGRNTWLWPHLSAIHSCPESVCPTCPAAPLPALGTWWKHRPCLTWDDESMFFSSAIRSHDVKKIQLHLFH